MFNISYKKIKQKTFYDTRIKLFIEYTNKVTNTHPQTVYNSMKKPFVSDTDDRIRYLRYSL